MEFSSMEFLLCFLPLFLLLYGVTPRHMKNVVLLTGSLVFYAFGEPEYLWLLIVSVSVNYFLGLHLARGARLKGKDRKQRKRKLEYKRKCLLAVAVAGNIGVLAVFKTGIGVSALPLGISYYTFRILSYLIDVYKGEETKETSFLRLATYITMFPQLLSGPIARYGEVKGALYEREFSAKNIQAGLQIFTVGLVFKVLLADRLGLLWREVQVTGFESISTPLAWIAAVAYSMKLYFDFYGYSLMAVGLGQMLGFSLPSNFNNPYMAGSVRKFYRRWHMTLGQWFCRYVYIPLGGNRKGEWRTLFHLLCVWLLTALWHGRTLNFLLWGLMLWILIVMERQMERLGVGKLFSHGILKGLPHLYLWFVIPISWMCFAITDISQLGIYLGRMFGVVEGIRVSAGDWEKALVNYGALFAAGGFACTPLLQKLFQRFKDSLPGMILLIALFWFCIWRLQIEGQNPFMYRNF
ncbi:MAG: MBOAT family protein [Blautia sp.]|nr:MBOAT family protein [Blautia sp.]